MTSLDDIRRKAYANAVNIMAKNSSFGDLAEREKTDQELTSYAGPVANLGKADQQRYIQIQQASATPTYRQNMVATPQAVDEGTPSGVGAWLLDIVNRSSWALGGAMRGVLGDENDEKSNPFARAWAGLTGEEKISPGTALLDDVGRENLSHGQQFLTQLLGDVVLDPLNAVPGKAVASGINAVKKAVNLVTDAQRAEHAIAVADDAVRTGAPTPAPTTPEEALGVTAEPIPPTPTPSPARIIDSDPQLSDPDAGFLSGVPAKASDAKVQDETRVVTDRYTGKPIETEPGETQFFDADGNKVSRSSLFPEPDEVTPPTDRFPSAAENAAAQADETPVGIDETPAPVEPEVPSKKQMYGLSKALKERLAQHSPVHDADPNAVISVADARKYKQALVNDDASVNDLFTSKLERAQVEELLARYTEKTGDTLSDISAKATLPPGRPKKVVEEPTPGKATRGTVINTKNVSKTDDLEPSAAYLDEADEFTPPVALTDDAVLPAVAGIGAAPGSVRAPREVRFENRQVTKVEPTSDIDKEIEASFDAIPAGKGKLTIQSLEGMKAWPKNTKVLDYRVAANEFLESHIDIKFGAGTFGRWTNDYPDATSHGEILEQAAADNGIELTAYEQAIAGLSQVPGSIASKAVFDKTGTLIDVKPEMGKTIKAGVRALGAVGDASAVAKSNAAKILEAEKEYKRVAAGSSKGAEPAQAAKNMPVRQEIEAEKARIDPNGDEVTKIPPPAEVDQLIKTVIGGTDDLGKEIKGITDAAIAKEGGFGSVTQSRIYIKIRQIVNAANDLGQFPKLVQGSKEWIAATGVLRDKALDAMEYMNMSIMARGFRPFVQDTVRTAGGTERWNLGMDDVFKALSKYGSKGGPRAHKYGGNINEFDPTPTLLGTRAGIPPSAVVSGAAASLDFRNSERAAFYLSQGNEKAYKSAHYKYVLQTIKNEAEAAWKKIDSGGNPAHLPDDALKKLRDDYPHIVTRILMDDETHGYLVHRMAVNARRAELKDMKDYAVLTSQTANRFKHILGETPNGTTGSALVEGMKHADKEIEKSATGLGASPTVTAAAEQDAAELAVNGTGDLAKAVVDNAEKVSGAQKKAFEAARDSNPTAKAEADKAAREGAAKTNKTVRQEQAKHQAKEDADAAKDNGTAPGNTVKTTDPNTGEVKIETITPKDKDLTPKDGDSPDKRLYQADKLSEEAEKEIEATIEAVDSLVINPKATLKAMNEAYRVSSGVIYTSRKRMAVRRDFASSAKELDGKDSGEILARLRKNEDVAEAPVTQKLYRAMMDPGSGPFAKFFLNGGTVEQFDEMMKQAQRISQQPGKSSWKLTVKKTKPKGKGKEKTAIEPEAPQTWEQYLKQMDDWKIDDVTEFMSVMDKVSQDLTHRQQVMIGIEDKFGSTTPKPGYRQLTAAESKGFVTSYGSGYHYYPEEIIENFAKFDKRAGSPTDYSESKNALAKLVNTVYDPANSIWKQTVTIWRPGHHVRNFLGDLMLNFVNAGMGIRSLTKHYAQASNLIFGRKLEDTYATIKLNGETIKLNGRQITEMADAEALLPEFHTLEQLENKGGKLYDRFQKFPLSKAGGIASEKVSSQARFAQFLYEMNKPSNIKAARSLEELRAIAGTEVRRHHPDVTGLTPKERRLMTRAMPFYSWWRQTLPRIAEGLITHPARSIAPFKVNYAMAVAGGENPPSMADQWNDADWPYPSFLKEGINGPVSGGGMGFGFNLPIEGFLGSQGLGALSVPEEGNGLSPISGGLQQLLGMTSPILRTPLEYASGQNFALGTVIPDKGEYLSGQLPIASDLGKILGIDTAGTIGSMFTTNPELQKTRSVEKKETSPVWNPALVNYLFGAGMTDTRKDSYLNIGMREV